MGKVDLLVFDMDDTLIKTTELYMKTCEEVAMGIDVDPCLFWELFSILDTINVSEAENIFSKDTFPRSVHDTVMCLTKDKTRAVAAGEFAYSVYDMKALRSDSASSVLLELSNYTKCILTKGSKEVQYSRLIASGFYKSFDQVFVVDKKTPEVFHNISRYYNTEPHKCVMIGDSIKSDITPALEAGFYAFYIHRDTYDHEGYLQIPPETPRYTKFNNLGAILEVLND